MNNEAMKSLINRLIMVTGSWLMAQGSWLKALKAQAQDSQCSCLMAKRAGLVSLAQGRAGAGPAWAPGPFDLKFWFFKVES